MQTLRQLLQQNTISPEYLLVVKAALEKLSEPQGVFTINTVAKKAIMGQFLTECYAHTITRDLLFDLASAKILNQPPRRKHSKILKAMLEAKLLLEKTVAQA